VKGYLVDANHVQAHFERVASFMSKVRSVPVSDLLWLCATTLGEIQAGHEMSTTTNEQRRREFDKFVIDQYQHVVLEVGSSTPMYYAWIMGRVWNKHRPANHRIGTDTHLVSLGVDVNDVWLVATAWEHGLIVLTHDKMPCIREAAPEVRFDCWI
jgi:predicted nucleic acid-binding protein